MKWLAVLGAVAVAVLVVLPAGIYFWGKKQISTDCGDGFVRGERALDAVAGYPFWKQAARSHAANRASRCLGDLAQACLDVKFEAEQRARGKQRDVLAAARDDAEREAALVRASGPLDWQAEVVPASRLRLCGAWKPLLDWSRKHSVQPPTCTAVCSSGEQ